MCNTSLTSVICNAKNNDIGEINMIDRSQYSEQTLKLYDILMDLKNEIMINISKNKKESFIGRLNEYKFNWEKHIIDNSLIDTQINKEIVEILEELQILEDLNLKCNNRITKDKISKCIQNNRTIFEELSKF